MWRKKDSESALVITPWLALLYMYLVTPLYLLHNTNINHGNAMLSVGQHQPPPPPPPFVLIIIFWWTTNSEQWIPNKLIYCLSCFTHNFSISKMSNSFVLAHCVQWMAYAVDNLWGLRLFLCPFWLSFLMMSELGKMNSYATSHQSFISQNYPSWLPDYHDIPFISFESWQ